jgi:hypothetical protein
MFIPGSSQHLWRVILRPTLPTSPSQPVFFDPATPKFKQKTRNKVHNTKNRGHRSHNTEHRPQNTEHRTQNTEHRTQNTEHRTQVTGNTLQVTRDPKQESRFTKHATKHTLQLTRYPKHDTGLHHATRNTIHASCYTHQFSINTAHNARNKIQLTNGTKQWSKHGTPDT